uniref:Cytochrome c oxidase subunit 2 n=2 Tax=Pterocladia TaxID=28859 RepID=A0A1D8X7N8_9FLOR|nr:cytochrome c oxidase subunit 2 [Pterocladia mexicana]YP_009317650.1 cytochrome c oxidase subunit 2 [Pterocladia robusta]YP_011017039.1 cytochrome c oxidase subunit 2 [Pterocladiella capillacea]AOX49056.1 cytochrome c oxidase subunit 2 [Pterocladia mexicana]AOX49102.1 cytochrome c oxidase subunit 2 [Pterocladia robusta]WQB61717.1 cytochrome c oxidase subunit 2 [Pterocladiella capillacea]
MSKFTILFYFLFFPLKKGLSDSAENWQLGFQDPATPIMEGIINLHHDLMFFVCVVSIFVTWMLFRTLWHFSYHRNKIPSSLSHGTLIEIVWTVTPAIILLVIAIPSFSLLYAMDEIISPAITIKTLGHQWYWSYEYSDYLNEDGESILYDSYMIPEEDLEIGQLRLLEVDNRMVIPINTHVRLIVSAADVLHSWAVPSLGIKCDAIPGRLNQTSLFIKREGVYYGQCSEICGINHGFMPIVVEAVTLPDYISWISNKLSE